MRNLRIAAGIAVAIALSFAALASAQDAGTEDPLRPDGPDAAAAAETDEAAEIPEELLEASVLDEIEVVVDPQGRSAFDIEEQREAQIRETIYAELRMRERREEEMPGGRRTRKGVRQNHVSSGATAHKRNNVCVAATITCTSCRSSKTNPRRYSASIFERPLAAGRLNRFVLLVLLQYVVDQTESLVP